MADGFEYGLIELYRDELLKEIKQRLGPSLQFALKKLRKHNSGDWIRGFECGVWLIVDGMQVGGMMITNCADIYMMAPQYNRVITARDIIKHYDHKIPGDDPKGLIKAGTWLIKQALLL